MPLLVAARTTADSGGTPGLTPTSDARATRATAWAPRSTVTPSASSSRAVLSSAGERDASDAYTLFPVRASSVATARPLRARPMTAISRCSQSGRSAGADTRAGGTLAHLQCAQREHRHEDPD